MNLHHIIEQLDQINVDDHSWRNDAKCRGLPAELFMPVRGDQFSAQEAKQVCAQCTVRWHCLAYGVAEKYGVWGGFPEKPRRRINAAWRRHTQQAS